MPETAVARKRHKKLLGGGASEAAKLDELYASCDETQLRGLWRELDVAAHPELLSCWTAWALRVSPSTRLLLVERIVASGLAQAEPFLGRLVEERDEDHAVRLAALRGLCACGTRRSMALLHDALTRAHSLDEDDVASVAGEAIAQIEARSPVEVESAGALELASSGGAIGALSSPGGHELTSGGEAVSPRASGGHRDGE